jgi:probable phosphoglycerate mutase
MSTRLLLVRHGQTAWNADGRFMGQLDFPSDEMGRAQVLAVAKRLVTEQPAAIYSSDLVRARETALAIQSAIGSHPPITFDARLREMHFGDWQGQTYGEMMERDAAGLAKWQADPLHVAPPNGETLLTLAGRVEAAYKEICAAHPEQTIIVTGHGGSLQILIVAALGLPPGISRNLQLSNASLSELRGGDVGAMLFLLNDTSHLSGIG